MTLSEINILTYLINVAPVVFVMGVAIAALWKKHNSLIDKIHERDVENLKTLEQMLNALRNIETKGEFHFNEIKNHVTERISFLRNQI